MKHNTMMRRNIRLANVTGLMLFIGMGAFATTRPLPKGITIIFR